MNLSPPLAKLATDAAASAAGATARCAAANFRWERAVSDARALEYRVFVGDVAAHKNWQAEHQAYLNEFVHVAKSHARSSESFMALNAQAHLNEQMDNTLLVRLESLDRLNEPLYAKVTEKFWWRFFNSQKDLRKDRLSDTDEGLRAAFAQQLKEKRDQARPMFSAFLNDLGGDLDALVKRDWPHILRDRLGLTHYLPGPSGQPLPVVLVAYSVDEVRQARAMATKKGAVASFARPTVLDGEMSAAFVPAPLRPGGASYGYTLDLAGAQVPTSFVPELLAFPIEYQAQHIKALGFITRAHPLLAEADLLAARNRHVQGLRQLPGCGDFGEVLV